MDFAKVTITWDIFIAGPYAARIKSQLNNRQNTQNLTILQSESALPSTGSWLPSRLSSTLRWADCIERIFSNSKYAKKRDNLSEK